MFADDKSIENFQQLFFEFKKYLELQKEYTKLELTEKLTILLSTLIMIANTCQNYIRRDYSTQKEALERDSCPETSHDSYHP